MGMAKGKTKNKKIENISMGFCNIRVLVHAVQLCDCTHLGSAVYNGIMSHEAFARGSQASPSIS